MTLGHPEIVGKPPFWIGPSQLCQLRLYQVTNLYLEFTVVIPSLLPLSLSSGEYKFEFLGQRAILTSLTQTHSVAFSDHTEHNFLLRVELAIGEGLPIMRHSLLPPQALTSLKAVTSTVGSIKVLMVL